MKISLLTGGKDPHYALGLLTGLIPQKIDVDFIGNDEMKGADIVKSDKVVYYNLREDQTSNVATMGKAVRVIKYYIKLISYAAKTDSKLFHILWLNKFTYFDRTLLNLYYKLLGKKLVFTAHNINIAQRDGKDSFMNRWSLRYMYRLADHIFVHTKKMKMQLIVTYDVRADKLSVIPFGINNIIPKSGLTRLQAKNKLHLEDKRKTILFFGNIAPYKGLDYLISAFACLKKESSDFRLLIAGRIKNCEAYWKDILKMIDEQNLNEHICNFIQYIPDEEVELYFKSADVLVLPYKCIFQSGVIFLSYSFGLPVIATDVGSLKEEVVEGETGFVCNPEDPEDLAGKIIHYFHSNLFKNLEMNREKITRYANEKYSFKKVGEKTYDVYKDLLSEFGESSHKLAQRTK